MMKVSNLVTKRFKETPADCQIASQALMVRGGYLKYVANGIFSSYLPLRRVTRKIEQILREEMDAIGSVALRIISISFLFAGFCIIAGSVCQAIGNPFYSLIVSVARQLVVLLPVAWLLAQTGRLELVWVAFPIAELMSLTLSVIFLRRTLRSAEARLKARTQSAPAAE